MLSSRILVNLTAKITELVIRAACGLPYKIEETIASESIIPLAREIVETLPPQIVVEDHAILRCKLCGKGPFTKKGLYLHLMRVHKQQIEDLVREELGRKLWVMRNTIK